MTADEVLTRLKRQAVIFGNPKRLILDRDFAFTSEVFEKYCNEEGINHVLIITEVPKGNEEQIERINRSLFQFYPSCPFLNQEWCKHVDTVQQHLNFSFSCSIGKIPFEIMIGTRMKWITSNCIL